MRNRCFYLLPCLAVRGVREAWNGGGAWGKVRSVRGYFGFYNSLYERFMGFGAKVLKMIAGWGVGEFCVRVSG